MASPEDALRELQLLRDIAVEEGEWPRYFVGTREGGGEAGAMAGSWDWGDGGEYDCVGAGEAVAEL